MATEDGKKLAGFGQSDEGNPMGFVTGPGARQAGFDGPTIDGRPVRDFSKNCPTGSTFQPHPGNRKGGKCIDDETGEVVKTLYR